MILNKKEICPQGVGGYALKGFRGPPYKVRIFSSKIWLVAPLLKGLERLFTNLQKFLYLKEEICQFSIFLAFQIFISVF